MKRFIEGASRGIRLRAQNLARMAASARYFGFVWSDPAAQLDAACAALDDGAHRMRLALNASGTFTLQSAPLAALAQPVRVLVAQQPTFPQDVFLRHKTSIRSTYDAAWRAGAFDTLFFNERDELTEGGRSNVFVQVDGRWITPALSCGLLPGVMRAALLADPVWDANEASSPAPWSRAPPPSWPAMPCAVR
jgi:para-aminobenzoate synthetase/4-amino-4-deoxychorismate lyase